ncbi:hypothetical protein [Natrialba sp. SSL1]|uniref:hypothetical protein n=1 Tax=Natrialba sp. SSL1 TaxID=1869245 RepID=UPI0008F7FB3C|nr:hypothetical protein [Natrialba sp. SSL1]OIB56607.1 hypothetical protein BBD46_16595 [Natrialba sp. SSL1]
MVAAGIAANRTVPDSDSDGLTGLQKRILFENREEQKSRLQQRMYQKSLQAAKQEYGPEGVEQQKALWQAAANGLQKGYRKGAMGGISANAQRLDYDEWEDRDDLQVTEARIAKTAVEDLIDAGLDRDVSPARLVSLYQVRSDAYESERGMNLRSQGNDDQPVKFREGVALPYDYVDWEIDERELMNSQNFGEDAEAEGAEEAGEQLADSMEDLVFRGWNTELEIQGGLYSVDGYLTTDYKLEESGFGPWSEASNVVETVQDLQGELNAQTEDRNRGYNAQQEGVWLYYPTAQWGNLTLQPDPQGDGNMNLLQRLQQDFPWIDFRMSGALDPDQCVMVVQNSDVVDLADGQAPTTMSGEIDMGLATKYKHLGMRVPRIKATYDEIYGIAVGTGIDG